MNLQNSKLSQSKILLNCSLSAYISMPRTNYVNDDDCGSDDKAGEPANSGADI